MGPPLPEVEAPTCEEARISDTVGRRKVSHQKPEGDLYTEPTERWTITHWLSPEVSRTCFTSRRKVVSLWNSYRSVPTSARSTRSCSLRSSGTTSTIFSPLLLPRSRRDSARALVQSFTSTRQ